MPVDGIEMDGPPLATAPRLVALLAVSHLLFLRGAPESSRLAAALAAAAAAAAAAASTGGLAAWPVAPTVTCCTKGLLPTPSTGCCPSGARRPAGRVRSWS